MSLQNFYYVYAIIFMTLYLLLLIAGVVGVFYIKHRIDELTKMVGDKIDDLKQKPADVAMDLGTSVALGAIKRLRKIITP